MALANLFGDFVSEIVKLQQQSASSPHLSTKQKKKIARYINFFKKTYYDAYTWGDYETCYALAAAMYRGALIQSNETTSARAPFTIPSDKKIILVYIKIIPEEILSEIKNITHDFFLYHSYIYSHPPISSIDDGVAIIHRIWVGRALTPEELQQLNVNNSMLASRWRTSQGSKAEVLFKLWTNNKSMLAINNTEFAFGIEILDIEELLDSKKIDPYICQHCRLLLHRREFSFAGDILKILIMFLEGGLYLDMTWSNYALSDFSKPTFNPKLHTLKVYAGECSSAYRWPVPFSHTDISPKEIIGQYKNFAQELSPWMATTSLESNIFYVGAAETSFAKTVMCNLLATLKSETYQQDRLEVIKLTHTDEGDIEPEDFHKKIGVKLHPGDACIIGALLPALLELKYTNPVPYLLALPEENRFRIIPDAPGCAHCTSLAMRKVHKLSWGRHYIKQEGSAEWP